jgi:hypothetical protein
MIVAGQEILGLIFLMHKLLFGGYFDDEKKPVLNRLFETMR